ncbi:hypothetical protein C8R45DRAFT_348000 [Mycena sanguinolenta]|nr:hypothetical protein C8R45DRAFT_348000 [Mycena sanguinolenta]
MSLLGGIFARNSSCGRARKSKSASDLHTLPTIAPFQSLSFTSTYDASAATSSASFPTAEYVYVASAGPSSPNGRGLAYADEPNLHRYGEGKTKGDGGGGLWFFGRRRSRNDLSSPMPECTPLPQRRSPLSHISSLSPASPAPSYSGSGERGGSRAHLRYSFRLSMSPTELSVGGWTARSAGAKSAGAKSGAKLARLFGGGKEKEGRASPTPTRRGTNNSFTAFAHGALWRRRVGAVKGAWPSAPI